MNCPCGSKKDFAKCCQPIISGKEPAQTAEALMRSRYTAYTQADIAYVKKTLAPESSHDFNAADAKKWATQSEWKGLKIISTEKGGTDDTVGTVEFVATYAQQGETIEHHEVAKFRKDKKQWLFVDAEAHTHKEGEDHHHHEKVQTYVRETAKVGRNDPCTCGSGKKYKKCCGVNA